MPVYNKLVRDLIPDIIKEAGKNPKIEVLDKKGDYYGALLDKLEEEWREFLNPSLILNSEAVEELADMMEVIYALAKMHRASEAELNAVREKKKKEKGGFDNRVFLVEVQD